MWRVSSGVASRWGWFYNYHFAPHISGMLFTFMKYVDKSGNWFIYLFLVRFTKRWSNVVWIQAWNKYLSNNWWGYCLLLVRWSLSWIWMGKKQIGRRLWRWSNIQLQEIDEIIDTCVDNLVLILEIHEWFSWKCWEFTFMSCMSTRGMTGKTMWWQVGDDVSDHRLLNLFYFILFFLYCFSDFINFI